MSSDKFVWLVCIHWGLDGDIQVEVFPDEEGALEQLKKLARAWNCQVFENVVEDRHGHRMAQMLPKRLHPVSSTTLQNSLTETIGWTRISEGGTN